jgi:hypothetical protein
MEIELAALKMQCFRVLDAVLLMILPFQPFATFTCQRMHETLMPSVPKMHETTRDDQI